MDQKTTGPCIFYTNIAEPRFHHLDISQDDGKWGSKKGRINSDLPFL